jgi:hypothetical protein
VIKKWFHIHNQVLFHGQAQDGLDHYLVGFQILNKHLARQPVYTIDTDRIGSTNPVSASPAETQGAILIAFDPFHQIQDPVSRFSFQCEGIIMFLPVILRIVTKDLQLYLHGIPS